MKFISQMVQLLVTFFICLTISTTSIQASNKTYFYEGIFFSKFYVKIDAFKDSKGRPHIRYNIDMPENTYFAFSYGQNHHHVDMVSWIATKDNVTVIDQFSYHNYKPPTDAQQDYNITSYQASIRQSNSTAKRWNFTCVRLFDTGDIYQDYIISVNSSIGMGVAYADASKVIAHFKNKGKFALSIVQHQNGAINISGSTIGGVDESGKIQKPEGNFKDGREGGLTFPIIHGWLLWIGWGVLGIFQVFSIRYLKIYWKLNIILHTIFGTATLLINTVFCIIGINYMGAFIRLNLHNLFGLISFFATFFIVAAGFYARYLSQNLEWKSIIINRVTLIHKVGGATLLLVGQLAIITGVLYYNDDYSANETSLGIIHIITFFAVLVLCELIYQIYQRRQPAPFIVPERTMTSDEFNKNFQEQQMSLVILDNLVLDVSDYMMNHPGGKFLLEYNIGRDISKFFYGGYSQDGNLISNGTASMAYTHSNLSRLQVNTIAIARLIPNQNQITQDNTYSTPQFTASVSSRWQINKKTQSIEFKILDGKDNEHPKNFYPDIQMIGKHFLVNDKRTHKVKRHYTIANCMIENVYNLYIEALKPESAGQPSTLNTTLMNLGDQFFCLTIKNYQIRGGLSQRIFEDDPNAIYEVMGPMGKGLGMQSEGAHIAFTAGTGILVFADLVAHLARKNLGMMESLENEQLTGKFKFILYASFPSEEEAICHNLCMGLSHLSENMGLSNFIYLPRFSNQNKKRWDQDFIADALKNHNDIKMVWVSGPPAMNEMFDKYLPSLDKTFYYEVM